MSSWEYNLPVGFPGLQIKIAFVFGNEVFGVQEEVIAMCDDCIEIPQLGTKHSLNVSISGGIIMWQAFSKWNEKNR